MEVTKYLISNDTVTASNIVMGTQISYYSLIDTNKVQFYVIHKMKVDY